MEFGATNPAERFWRNYAVKRRGDLGGFCNNALCSGTRADWLNIASGRYYCADCAQRINANCLEQGRRRLCEPHP